MKTSQSPLFFLIAFIHCQFSAASVFCSGRSEIDIPAGADKNFACPGTTNGQVRIRWETSNLTPEGFSDDEYYINVIEDAVEVHSDGQYFDASFGSSIQIGPDGGDAWVVQFHCDLEFSWFNCEDGDFSYVLVDCGCPPGMRVETECSVSSMNSASDATCVPGTPFPTESPNSSPAASPTSNGFGCFSGDTLVDVKDSDKLVPMKNLQVGDRIRTKSSSYEPVYAFGHHDTSTMSKFVQIHANGEDPPLELTLEHMVFLNGKSAPVPAGSLVVGDVLSTADGKGRAIKAIKTSWKEGLYAPLTADGTLVVNNDISASNYIDVQASSDGYVRLNGIGSIPLSQATLFHAWLSPLRVYCMGVAASDRFCNNYNEEGYLHFVSLGLDFAQFMDRQSLPIQMATLVLTMMFTSAFLAVELVFGPSHGPLIVLLAFASLYQGFKMYGGPKSTKGQKVE